MSRLELQELYFLVPIRANLKILRWFREFGVLDLRPVVWFLCFNGARSLALRTSLIALSWIICLLKISSYPSKFRVRSRTRSTWKLIFSSAFLLLVTSFTSVLCLSSQVSVPFFAPHHKFSSAFFLIGIVKLLLPITRVNVNVPWTFHHKTLSLSGRIFIGGTNNATTKNISRLHVFHLHVPPIRATATDQWQFHSPVTCLTAADHEPSFSLESVVWQQWWCPLYFFWRFSEFLRLILVG